MGTRITRMEMKGFKSFAKPTELVFGKKFSSVLGPNGAGKSTSPDTEVLLGDGSVVKIGELVEKELENATEFLPLDDGVYCKNTSDTTVLTLNPKTMKVEERPVGAFARREGEKTLYKFTTKSGKSATTTGCHPVMILKDGEVRSEVVDNLAEGCRIAAPRELDIQGEEQALPQCPDIKSLSKRDKYIRFPEHTSRNFGRWLGIVIGDGYIHHQRVELTNAKKHLLDEWINLTKELFNITEPRIAKRNNAYIATFCTKKLPLFLASVFKAPQGKPIKTDCKHIPDVFMHSSKESIASLISGLIDTDGYVSHTTPTIELTMKNAKLIDQVQLLLLRFGILSRKTTSLKCATNTKAKIKREYTTISIEGQENLQKFMQIPIQHRMKQERLQHWASRNVQTNPNSDVLPRETNNIVKDLVTVLRMQPKCLRKEYPRLAAYVENRCCPSRKGIQIVTKLARARWDELANAIRNMQKNQMSLIQTLKIANIPMRHASIELGLHPKKVGDRWATQQCVAAPAKVEQLYTALLEELSDILVVADQKLQILETLASSDIVWEEITSIEEVPGSKYVYDLCIYGNHNFVANNLFVHNSNILDALVFVLGKSGAKGLRAEKSANLIYNGGKAKNPAKEGSVSIYFENKSNIFGVEEKELKVTRRIKQSGQSDYYINDKKRTRTEVVGLLEKARISPDGHNIILQGDIVHLIEMSGIERRGLIEEIAGIGIYEEKKQKALNELNRVEEKLNETQIIITEREAYLKELKSERDQAMKFKDLQDKLRRNKKTVLTNKMNKKTAEKDKFEAVITKNQEQIDKLTAEIEELKEQIKVHRKEVDAVNKEIERKGEKEQVALHKEVEELRVQIEVKKARTKQLRDEIQKVKDRKNELKNANKELFDKIKYIEEEKKTVQKDLREHEKEKAQVDARIKQFKAKHAVDDAGRVDKQMEEIDKKAEQLQEELGKLRAEQQELLREKDKKDILIEQADEKIAKVLEAEKTNKGQLATLKSKQDSFKKLTKELQQALSDDATHASQIQTARGKVATITESLTKLQAQNASLKEGAAGGIAISKILEQKEKIRGIIGTVAELGKVKKEHQVALEIAAGGRINGIVVEDDKTASECIQYLRKNQYGVATFLPMNKLKAPDVKKPGKTPGVLGAAVELIDFDTRYEKVFKYVFGNTWVVDSLSTARKQLGKVRTVTLDGDLAEVSGAMQGGFRQKKRGTGFQQKEMTEKIDKLSVELADQEGVLATVERKRKENQEAIDRLREHKGNLEAEIITLEKTLHIDSEDLGLNKEEKKNLIKGSKELEKELDDLVMKVSSANKELAKYKIEKQQLRDQISALRSPEVLAQLTSFEEKQESIRERMQELQTQLQTNEAQVKSVLGPEAARIENILKQQDKEINDFTKEQAEIAATLKVQEKELKAKDAKEKEFLAQFKDLFKKREVAANTITELDGKADTNQLKIREFEIKVTNASMELARIKAELAGFEEEAAQYEDVDVFKDKKEEACLLEIKQFERLLEGIGAVNMKALEMYEHVETEYKEIVEKKEKLTLERQDVLVMINEIDSKKKDIFMKTFEVLNENFKKIFLALSTKGEAFLEIEKKNDIFEGGISIKVKLTGKKFMDIRSLSGGEKTMTALAFLFAIQEHEPAYFYILDEVDAALDKHNSERLAKLVREYCKNAQYIVVSHNDSVISEADNLYGISMNEHGISKVTTLKI
ncbi:MAG: chromosome segregation protein SMC [Candidatus Woesearchaeota archaeon]|nr:chromosome segregation protein SMC [Candidatus Woesearchaeota archaeon]